MTISRYLKLAPALVLMLGVSCEQAEQSEGDGIVHVSSVQIGLDPQITIGLDETLVLSVKIFPENAEDQTYTLVNSNPAVVSLNDSTLVLTPLKPGSSIVGAVSTDGNIRAVSIVNVDEGFVHVSDIEINIPDQFNIIVKESYPIEVTVSPRKADNPKYSWEISDPGIVSIDEDDVLHALEIGTATICAVTEDKDKRCYSTVTVMPTPLTALQLDTHSIDDLEITSPAFVLGLTILPDDGYERLVKWSTSDISVCQVDDSGKVTITGGGTATVKVESVDGSDKSDQCVITVAGTAVKDRYYDAQGDNYADGYYKKLYEPLEIEVPHLTGVVNPDGTKEVDGTEKQIWLDRNLGAAQRAVSAWDPLAAGSLFQFGRNADGHEKTLWSVVKGKLTPTPVTGTTTVKATSRADAGTSQFIVSDDDWSEDQSITGWGGPVVSISDSKYNTNFNIYSAHADLDNASQASNPCPYGYRIPSATEFMQMSMVAAKLNDVVFGGENASPLNLIEAMHENMYMVVAGYRPGKGTAYSSSGTENNLSSGGFFYWTNASNTGTTITKAWQWKSYWNGTLSAFSAKVVSIVKSDGCSIRCIKDKTVQ